MPAKSSLKVLEQEWKDFEVFEKGEKQRKQFWFDIQKQDYRYHPKRGLNYILAVNGTDFYIIGGENPALLARSYDPLTSCLKVDMSTGEVTQR